MPVHIETAQARVTCRSDLLLGLNSGPFPEFRTSPRIVWRDPSLCLELTSVGVGPAPYCPQALQSSPSTDGGLAKGTLLQHSTENHSRARAHIPPCSSAVVPRPAFSPGPCLVREPLPLLLPLPLFPSPSAAPLPGTLLKPRFSPLSCLAPRTCSALPGQLRASAFHPQIVHQDVLLNEKPELCS